MNQHDLENIINHYILDPWIWQCLNACMKHSILLTRRWRSSLSILSPFNLQTIILNVSWCGFVLWVMTPKSVTSVMSTRFTILCIILCLFVCTEILNKSSCTTACFTVIFVFSNTRFRYPMGNYIQYCSTHPNYQYL